MSAKLHDVWAAPQATITEARLLLTLGEFFFGLWNLRKNAVIGRSQVVVFAEVIEAPPTFTFDQSRACYVLNLLMSPFVQVQIPSRSIKTTMATRPLWTEWIAVRSATNVW